MPVVNNSYSIQLCLTSDIINHRSFRIPVTWPLCSVSNWPFLSGASLWKKVGWIFRWIQKNYSNFHTWCIWWIRRSPVFIYFLGKCSNGLILFIGLWNKIINKNDKVNLWDPISFLLLIQGSNFRKTIKCICINSTIIKTYDWRYHVEIKNNIPADDHCK